MANTNDEIEILSQEEETHLDKSGDFNEVTNGNLQETNPKNKNLSQNINIEESEQHNNEEFSHNQKDSDNYDDEAKIKLTNFEPEKSNQKNRIKHFYHDEQDFSNPKYVMFVILQYLKHLNMQIIQKFSGVCTSIDIYIKDSNLHPNIKRFLNSKQILLIIYIFNIQIFLAIIEGISFLNFLNKLSLNLMTLSTIGLYAHYYFFNQKLFLEKDEEMEKFILKRNPKMKKEKCEFCDILKVMRSNHCIICNKCVIKFQFHSEWYSICIGANNELLYALTLILTNGYIFISNIIFWYYITYRSDLLNYLFLLYFLFALFGIYILYNTLKFNYEFIFENLFVNLTFNENTSSQRLPYLWNDISRKSFFNPFNKGLQRNLEEMWVNLFDIDIYSDYKQFSCQNLSEIIDDGNVNKEEDEIDENNDSDSFKMMIKLTQHIDPLITSKGNIYKFVDGKEIINWNRLMIFTAFDIINSPYKENMIKKAKNSIKQRELTLQKINKNSSNNINEDEKSENDEIKSNENNIIENLEN